MSPVYSQVLERNPILDQIVKHFMGFVIHSCTIDFALEFSL